MTTKNNYPSSDFESEDRCPSCGSPCNIHSDLDDNDECNDCREEDNIGVLELGQIIPKQETLEEAAENYSSYDEHKMDFIAGANWQQERSYSDMQEYAKFCIECDRKEMPLLLVEDWYEHYKKL